MTTTNEGTDTMPPVLGANRVLVKRTAKAVSQTPATTNMPMFPTTVTRTLAELTPRGGYVGVPVMAEDEDVDDGLDELTYALNGTDSRYFDLLPDPNDANRMTGQIRVKDGTAAGQFDAEGVKSSYTVRLMAMDKTGHEATTNVTIMVGNVNEAPTAPDQSFGLRINGSGAPSSIPELLSTMDVGRYRAGGAGGATVSWSLSGADMGQFSTIGADGVLSFKAMPDYENPMDAGGGQFLPGIDNGLRQRSDGQDQRYRQRDERGRGRGGNPVGGCDYCAHDAAAGWRHNNGGCDGPGRQSW